MARPADGLDYKRMAQITGLATASVKDALCKLRKSGDAKWLQRGRLVIHFGSDAERDAFEAANPSSVTVEAERKVREIANARPPRILEALRSAPIGGASAVQLSASTGITGGNVRRLLTDLQRAGEVWRYGPAHCLRWFASHEAMEAGESVVDAMVSARRDKVVVKRSNAGAASSKKRRAVEEKSFSLAAKKEEDKRIARREAQAATIVWPAHVKIQRAPTPRDGRYSADPGHIGEFQCEWRKLRCGGVA